MQKILSLILLAALLSLSACKSPQLQPGGVYSPTNSVGQVVYNDIGLALADAAYKLAYETVGAVLKFEQDNEVVIWAISPDIKHALDKVRVTGNDINLRWANARKIYRLNPTPAGLSTLQTILAEVQRLVPVAQQQLATVNSTLTKKQ